MDESGTRTVSAPQDANLQLLTEPIYDPGDGYIRAPPQGSAACVRPDADRRGADDHGAPRCALATVARAGRDGRVRTSADRRRVVWARGRGDRRRAGTA